VNSKNELRSIFLVLAALMTLLILVSSTALAATTKTVPPKIIETQITTNLSDSYDPAIYGNTIVW